MARFVRRFVSVNDARQEQEQADGQAKDVKADKGLNDDCGGGDAQKFNYFHLCELFVCQSASDRTGRDGTAKGI